MLISLWQRFKQRAAVWREVALPGLLIILLVLLVRWVGLLQIQEWMALDSLSRYCPSSTAQPIVLVGINEADLNAIGGFPISDRTLVDLLKTLQAYSPTAIGLDLFRDRPVQPGSDELAQILAQSPSVIGVERALDPQPDLNVKPPPMLPPTRVGFIDVNIDEDGKLRRMILAGLTQQGTLKHSFALQLAQAYLATQNIPVQSGTRASEPIQLGELKLNRFQPNSGGYIRTDARGNQILFNFCANQHLFQTLSLTQVLQQNFAPELIRDRVVIIGMTAPSVKDVFFTSALKETLSSSQMSKLLPVTQLIYGVEVQAYAVNQIIQVAFRQRPQLCVWVDLWEYLWIVFWGLLGILVEILLKSPWKSVLGLIMAIAVLVSTSFLALMSGWWIPLIPAGLALGGAGLVTTFVERNLRFELEYRRVAVERTYEAVHNGPLQHLAVILRNLDEDSSPGELQQQLQLLSEELRGIFQHMRQEMLTRSDKLYLKGNLILDLQAPISELLYQVYNYTLEIQAPGFAEIQTYISPDFEILKRNDFSADQKRGLCSFLQEALWNVGKHAIGATRLDVMCLREGHNYVLRITDNGFGTITLHEGQGTKQAKIIAWELGGRFQRRSHHPKGTICELIFPMQRNWLRRWKRI